MIEIKIRIITHYRVNNTFCIENQWETRKKNEL